MTKRQTIADWVHSQLVDDNNGGRCIQLTLVHWVQNSTTELKSFRICEGVQQDPADIGKMFLNIANNHAMGVPGTQQYEMLSFFEGSKEPVGHYPIRINGETEQQFGLGTEPPTTAGQNQMLMRHLEVTQRQMHTFMAGMVEATTGMLRVMSEQNQQLMREHHDAMMLSQQLIMWQGANAFDNTKALIDYKSQLKIKEGLFKLAPVIVNKVFGEGTIPISAADTALLDSFAESVTEEQILQLTQVLRPEQMALIADRFKRTLENKREVGPTVEDLEKSITPPLPPAPANGEVPPANGTNGMS